MDKNISREYVRSVAAYKRSRSEWTEADYLECVLDQLAAAEARAEKAERERHEARSAIRCILAISYYGVGDLWSGWENPIQNAIDAARSEGGE